MNREARQPRGAATTRKKAVSVNTETAGYIPTEREAAAIARVTRRRMERRAFPSLNATVEDSGAVDVAPDHKHLLTGHALQVDALGLAHDHEYASVLRGIFEFTSTGGKADAVAANQAIQLIVGLEPRNTTEALLATQMAAVHLASMAAARRLHQTTGTIESIAAGTKALNGLARTFSLQAEAMKKLKGGGQQKVVVEHKHYYLAPGAIANSQAVLGDVSQGRGTNEIERQPDERQASLPERTAVHGHLEANGVQVSGAGSDWLEGVPVSWGQRRSPERAS